MNEIGEVIITFSERFKTLEQLKTKMSLVNISDDGYLVVEYISKQEKDEKEQDKNDSVKLLSWHVTEFKHFGMKLKLNFSEPLEVSLGTQLD